MVRSAGFWVGLVGLMGLWSVGQLIVGVISFQKIFGLYGLKHHIVEISRGVTDAGRMDNQQVKIGLLSFWSGKRWVSQYDFSAKKRWWARFEIWKKGLWYMSVWKCVSVKMCKKARLIPLPLLSPQVPAHPRKPSDSKQPFLSFHQQCHHHHLHLHHHHHIHQLKKWQPLVTEQSSSLSLS